MGRNQEECNTAKWGKKRQLTSGCHLSFIGFPFFGPNFIFVLKVSSKTTHFTKKTYIPYLVLFQGKYKVLLDTQ